MAIEFFTTPLKYSVLLTSTKEIVMDPNLMNVEVDGLVRRLVESDQTKWPALEELRAWWGGRRR